MAKFKFKFEKFEISKKDNIFKTFLILWLVPLVLTLIYILFYFRNLPTQIPLFYSRLWGESQLAARPYIFLPVAGTFLLGIFNFSLATSFHSKDKIFSYLLSGTMILLSFLAAITTFNIINLLK